MSIRNTNMGGTDWQDTGSTTLNGSLNDSDTTITVVSTASFKSSGIILIESEKITYSGKTGTTFTGCTRGAYGSTATSHADTTAVTEKELLFAQDLNDTFDKAYSYIQTLTTFWLNSELYSAYDDFNSYTTGANITSGALYTVALNSAPNYNSTFTCQASTNAGGDTKEGRLQATSSSAAGGTDGIVKIINLTANRHTWMRTYSSITASGSGGSGGGLTEVSFDGGSTYHTIMSSTGDDGTTGTGSTQIMAVAQGSDQYKCYVGTKLVQTVSDATFEIWLKASCSGPITNMTTNLYIDDILQSANSV